MFQPATQATRPSPSRPLDPQWPNLPSLRASGWSTGGHSSGDTVFRRARHPCQVSSLLPQAPGCARLEDPVSTLCPGANVPCRNVLSSVPKACAYRTAMTGTTTLWLLISISLSQPVSRSVDVICITTICAVNPNLPFAFPSTNWAHLRERGNQQGRAPNLQKCSPCRSRDADIRTSAASEGASAHSPGTDKAAVRSGTNQIAHKHTSTLQACWLIVTMHLSLTTMFPAQRP